jgi:hypothetical protein
MMPTFAFAPIFPVDISSSDALKDDTSTKLETAEGKENEPSQNEDSQVRLDDDENVSTADKKVSNESVTDSEDFIVKLDYRMSSEIREKVNKVLQHFVGPHYFHNYTSGK